MGKDGVPVIGFIVLAVCGIHEDAVCAFAQERSVSEGFLIAFNGVSELIELWQMNQRIHPESICNVEGPVLVA
jgi:hypothetical protein